MFPGIIVLAILSSSFVCNDVKSYFKEQSCCGNLSRSITEECPFKASLEETKLSALRARAVAETNVDITTMVSFLLSKMEGDMTLSKFEESFALLKSTGFFEGGPSRRIAVFVHSASTPITWGKVYQNAIMSDSLWNKQIFTIWHHIPLPAEAGGPGTAFEIVYERLLKESFESANSYTTFTTVTVLKDVGAINDAEAYKKFSLVYVLPVKDGNETLNVHLLSEPT